MCRKLCHLIWGIWWCHRSKDFEAMEAGKLAIRPWLSCQYNENTFVDLPYSMSLRNILWILLNCATINKCFLIEIKYLGLFVKHFGDWKRNHVMKNLRKLNCSKLVCTQLTEIPPIWVSGIRGNKNCLSRGPPVFRTFWGVL